LQIKTKIVSCYTADSKPVKQEVNGKVILPTLVFPDPPLPALIMHQINDDVLLRGKLLKIGAKNIFYCFAAKKKPLVIQNILWPKFLLKLTTLWA